MILKESDIKYGLVIAPTMNLGDDVQTLAQKQYLPKVDYFINRERLNFVHEDIPTQDKIKIILSGWFLHNVDNWPPSPTIDPLFISFHIHDERLADPKYRTYYKKYEPIGCRDHYTTSLLTNIGVDAYTSYDLVTTLQKKQTSRTKKVYVVDVPSTFLQHIPEHILQHAEYIQHELPAGFDYFDYFKRLEIADALLKKYSAARLVITSRLHCALPCLAFGTPVLFFHPEYKTDKRFDGYHEYLQGFAPEDLVYFDFEHPKPINITPIKESLINTLQTRGFSLPKPRLTEKLAKHIQSQWSYLAERKR
ncbi:MAG TPA: polysaccharide pyruvyl transferase family protein [Patescibacteria group bacterium]|nr:polysaccharide pyruvyl transferase family protein [Patescibacteria group bacterium]